MLGLAIVKQQKRNFFLKKKKFVIKLAEEKTLCEAFAIMSPIAWIKLFHLFTNNCTWPSVFDMMRLLLNNFGLI